MEQNNMFVPEWDNAVNAERNEIVFENKNKQYGAFILRKNYNKNILFAFILTALTITAFTLIPLIQIWLKPVPKKVKEKAVAVEVKIEEIPQEKPEEKPVEIETPKIATIQATELAPSKEADSPTETDFDGENFGKTNQEGEDDPLPENPEESPSGLTGGGQGKKFVAFSRAPIFPGDLEAVLTNLLEYPEYEYNNGIQGQVMVSFTVNAQGKVTNAKVIKSLSPGCDKAALKAINGLPKFKPALQNGNPTSFPIVVPVAFNITE
ncbi:MAG: energy transducer TonB [Flavobacteriales bacterium]